MIHLETVTPENWRLKLSVRDDQRYQGNGFGYEAARQILQILKSDGRYDKVVLCYVEGDDAARRLYEKLGFHQTGEADGDEIVMELSL